MDEPSRGTGVLTRVQEFGSAMNFPRSGTDRKKLGLEELEHGGKSLGHWGRSLTGMETTAHSSPSLLFPRHVVSSSSVPYIYQDVLPHHRPRVTGSSED